MNYTTRLSGFTPDAETTIRALRQEVDVYRQTLEDLRQQPCPLGIVLTTSADRLVISQGGTVMEIPKPRDKTLASQLEPGVVVRMVHGTAGIHSVVDYPTGSGKIETVARIIDERQLELAVPGGDRAVFYRKPAPEPGDRVVLDLTGSVVVKTLGKTGSSAMTFKASTGVRWSDVGGCEDAKRALIEAIEEPVRYKDVYARYGKKPVKGVLLSGPPGCGKTLLGKAAATALADLHGKSANEGGFLLVKGPELLNKYLGETEAGVRNLFASARQHHAVAGYPAIIFVDEADAILGRRGARGTLALEGMERTIVPAFLTEMDGLEASGAMVLLSTNRPDVLDPAIVRDGRIDRKVHVTRPTRKEAETIFGIHLEKKPLADGLDAASAAEELFADRHVLFMIEYEGGGRGRFTLGDIASGALVAGVVEEAAQVAIRRELAGGDRHGVTRADVASAVKQKVHEQEGLDHTDDLEAFCEAEGKRPKSIKWAAKK